MTRWLVLAGLLTVPAAPLGAAEKKELPPGDDKPLLQLNVGGPTATVTALTFDARGTTLYAAGLDKVIRVYKLTDGTFRWTGSYRVPVGPGVAGSVNALAVSEDGWLAVAGRELMRGEAPLRGRVFVVPDHALPEEMLLDAGNIYLINLNDPSGGKVLRGHHGEVQALTFLPHRKGKPPLLVSAGLERHKAKPTGSVRLWDVAAGTELAALPGLPATRLFPGLAAWHTGAGAKQVRVAVAWPEDDARPDNPAGKCRLRVWDPAADKDALSAWRQGSWNGPLADLGGGQLATGYLEGGKQPYVALNRLEGAEGDPRLFATKTKVKAGDGVAYMAWAMTALSSKGDRMLDTVAVALQSNRADEPNQLELLGVEGDALTPRVRLSLANTDHDLIPRLAAAPGGRYLAVAGYKDHSTIAIFRIADLLRRKADPAVIPGPGVTFRGVAFVRKGGRPGLRLSEKQSEKLPTTRPVFDLAGRKLLTDADGWELDSPGVVPKGWEVEGPAEEDGVYVVRVRHGETAFPAVRLKPQQKATAWALLPSGLWAKKAVLAVAHFHRVSSEAQITLFDLESGKPFRRLDGHLQEVRGLAFSARLPLLASAADDQTTCVWDLRDLDDVSGAVEGLALADEGGAVVVRAVEPDSPAAAKKIKAGDVIDGVAPAGEKPRKLANALAFYADLDGRKPGSEVDVSVKGKGVLRLPVARGIDERKPLFSLFVPRGRGLWVGWSPLGFFDASGADAEKLVGWHTNTGDATAPVAFAALAKYRKEYYREGLLDALARGKGVPPAPQEDPDPAAYLDGARRDPDRKDLFVVRRKEATLRLVLNNAGYAPDDEDGAGWTATGIDGKAVAAGRLKRGEGNDWVASLDRLPWKPGDYRINIVYHSHKNGKDYPLDLVLRYLPAPPRLSATVRVKGEARVFTPELPADKRRLPVDERAIDVEVAAEAEPDAEHDLEVRLVLRRPGAEPVVLGTKAGKAKVTLTKKVDLEKGDQTLVVFAGPPKALTDSADADVSRVEVTVPCQPRKQTVKILDFRVVPAGRSRTIDGHETVVVDLPDVTLHARVEGTSGLTAVDWIVDKGEAESLLADKTKKAKSQEVEQHERLKEGKPRRLRLRVAAEDSDPKEQELWVVFYHPLPTLASGPRNEDVLVPRYTRKGELRLPDPKVEVKATLLVTPPGKQAASVPVKLTKKDDVERMAWEAALDLQPGVSILDLRVEDPRQPAWRFTVIPLGRVKYRRPPVVVKAPPVTVGKSPFVDVTAVVRAPTDDPPVTARVNEGVFEKDALVLGKPKKDGDFSEWELTVKGVPVNPMGMETKPDHLMLAVGNGDGYREPVRVKLMGEAVSGEPPVVHFPELPKDGVPLQKAEFPLRYVVTSKSDLRGVRLLRERVVDGKPVAELLHTSPLKGVTKEGGEYRLDETFTVPLRSGENRLRLVVESVGHGARDFRVPMVIRFEAPVLVRVLGLQRLEGGAGAGAELRPKRAGDEVEFAAAPQGLMLLRGEVIWSDGNAPELAAAREVQALVNNARQFPVSLGARGPGSQANRRPFAVPIALTRERGNEVVIEVPGLKTGERSQTKLTLDCAKPWKEHRLHVLIVGIDVKDPRALKDSFFKAIGARPPEGLQGGEFETALFKTGILYPVLYGPDIDGSHIRGAVLDIEKVIRRLKNRDHWVNDVVLIYYQGQLGIDPEGRRWLYTWKNLRWPNLPLADNALALDTLPPLPGVQLMLLNVNRKAPKVVKGGGRKDEPSSIAELDYVALGEKQIGKPDPAFLTWFGKALDQAKSGELREVREKLLALAGGPEVLINLVPPGLDPIQLRPPVP